MTRVLVVEDEESYSDALAYMLRKEGYEVAIAADGNTALTEFDRFGPDIVLLDLMLPGIPGTEVCRQIRQTSSVPVIMVSAKDDEVDKVVGLELGADDYVTKPYSPRELVARIRAVLRRGQEPDLMPDTLEAGPVRMDVERHVVTVDGSEQRLPLKEFELLELFLRNPGRVLTRGQLIDRVWGSDYVGDTKTLDVHVKRLRAKLEPDPSEPKLPRHRPRAGLQAGPLRAFGHGDPFETATVNRTATVDQRLVRVSGGRRECLDLRRSLMSPCRPATKHFSRTMTSRLAVAVTAALVAAPLVTTSAAAAPPGIASSVALGSAAGFSVLAGPSIANTGAGTVLALDLGVTGTLAGFPPGTVTGTKRIGTPAVETAHEDRQAAYDAVVAQTGGTPFGGDLAGTTFTPGLYSTAAAITNTGTITLDADGDPSAVFVFQIGAALSSAASTKVVLTDGALANNVYWQAVGAVALGANAKWVGTILGAGAITFGDGASLKGRALTPSTMALANSSRHQADRRPGGTGGDPQRWILTVDQGHHATDLRHHRRAGHSPRHGHRRLAGPHHAGPRRRLDAECRRADRRAPHQWWPRSSTRPATPAVPLRG